VTQDEALRRAFADAPVARVATVGSGGAPHVAARWFVWRPEALYVSTRLGGTTWRNAEGDPRVAVVIDRGRDWVELAGVHLEGAADLLPAEHPDMREAMSAWHEKYRSLLSGAGFERLAADVVSLGFLRLDPSAVRTWDHRAEPA